MTSASVSTSMFSLAQQWVHGILLAGEWQKRLIAVSAGAVSAGAMAPINFFPVLFATFPVLVWLLDSTGGRGDTRRNLVAAAGIGWWFGFGFFLAGLWWLGVAFVVGGEKFIWLMPLGVVALPAALALFFALGLGVARLFWGSSTWRIFALALGLGFSEWLRSWLFTGFPWNGFGQVFANHLLLVQGASLLGAEGLGALAVAVFAAPALIVTGTTSLQRWFFPGLGVVLLLALALFGYLRLLPTGGTRIDFDALPMVPGVRLRIMQPNVPQDEKNAPRDGRAVIADYLTLSDRVKGAHASGIADVTHLIWPEAPFPFILERNAEAIRSITGFLPPTTQLITGAVRVEQDPAAPDGRRFYNSMQVLDRSGIVGTYDKVHLVPFGEYLPFGAWLSRLGLEQFVRVIGGFSASPSRRELAIAGLPPVTPMICFEAIFPAELGAEEAGPRVFVNVTNDAWFGATFGPYQHLAQARLRAVEFGQPVIRAANSGVSAVFDPFGRVVASLPLGVKDVIDAPLPAGLASTLYRQSRWYSFATVMFFFAVLAALGRIRS
ncbi:MAG: apolipoprotein N-acyltransferase [Proteobacteria bacterium]|nr:apolipoprotein N-acyltransferase [Pseudomonadota bacterium]